MLRRYVATHISIMTATRRLAIVCLLTAFACETRDPCLDAHRELVPSPSGSRQVNISTGPCSGSAPQVLIEFDHGAGGTGVFAVMFRTVSASEAGFKSAPRGSDGATRIDHILVTRRGTRAEPGAEAKTTRLAAASCCACRQNALELLVERRMTHAEAVANHRTALAAAW